MPTSTIPRVTILRGSARILAAATGLLLVYGITFALEGMTTRIPTTATWEQATGTLWTAPWLLLFCSGLQDVTIVTGKQWVLWVGGFAALVFLYYFDHYASLSLATKAAMPPITVSVRVDSSLHQETGLSIRPVISCSRSSRDLCSIQCCRYVVFANGTFRDEGHRSVARCVLFVSDYKRGPNGFRPLPPSDALFCHVVVEKSSLHQ